MNGNDFRLNYIQNYIRNSEDMEDISWEEVTRTSSGFISIKNGRYF